MLVDFTRFWIGSCDLCRISTFSASPSQDGYCQWTCLESLANSCTFSLTVSSFFPIISLFSTENLSVFYFSLAPNQTCCLSPSLCCCRRISEDEKRIKNRLLFFTLQSQGLVASVAHLSVLPSCTRCQGKNSCLCAHMTITSRNESKLILFSGPHSCHKSCTLFRKTVSS